MSASKPYFKNVINVGDLFFEYSFMYMDGPIVFTCVDKQENLYLCVCRDAYEQVEWIVSKIDVYTLINLVGNQISINEALLSSRNEIIQIIWKPKTKTEYSKSFLIDSLPDDLLSEEDVFLDDDGESNEYVRRVVERNKSPYLSVSLHQSIRNLSRNIENLCSHIESISSLQQWTMRGSHAYLSIADQTQTRYQQICSCKYS